MVPKVVQDAGYTAVGLGVMAVQQVQTKRRAIRSVLTSQLKNAGVQACAVAGLVRQLGTPIVAPVAGLVDGGKQKLRQTLRLTSN